MSKEARFEDVIDNVSSRSRSFFLFGSFSFFVELVEKLCAVSDWIFRARRFYGFSDGQGYGLCVWGV